MTQNETPNDPNAEEVRLIAAAKAQAEGALSPYEARLAILRTLRVMGEWNEPAARRSYGTLTDGRPVSHVIDAMYEDGTLTAAGEGFRIS